MNYTAELALLMRYTGATAIAIRMYSAYNSGGDPSRFLRVPYDPKRDSVDLMFLADSLHNFGALGRALQEEVPARVIEACNHLLSTFSEYDQEISGVGRRQAKPTFERWREHIDLNMAREAIAGIRDKAMRGPA